MRSSKLRPATSPQVHPQPSAATGTRASSATMTASLWWSVTSRRRGEWRGWTCPLREGNSQQSDLSCSDSLASPPTTTGTELPVICLPSNSAKNAPVADLSVSSDTGCSRRNRRVREGQEVDPGCSPPHTELPICRFRHARLTVRRRVSACLSGARVGPRWPEQPRTRRRTRSMFLAEPMYSPTSDLRNERERSEQPHRSADPRHR